MANKNDDLGQIFKMPNGSFILVTHFSDKLNGVGELMELACGPSFDPRYEDYGVSNSWEYLYRLPMPANYVPASIRTALENFDEDA